MKKKVTFAVAIVLIFICIIGIIVKGAAVVYAEEGIYQGIEEIAKESGDINFIEYMDNYVIDMEKSSIFKDVFSIPAYLFTNFIFSLQKDLTKMVIIIFDLSMTANISSFAEIVIEPFVSEMKTTIFDKFALFMIGISAFIFLVRMMVNRTGQVLANIITLVVITALAIAFYTYPIQLLDGLDSVSTEVANSVLAAPYEAIDNQDSSAANTVTGKASSVIWNVFVHKPWQLLEFGSVKTAEIYENEVLIFEPGSKEREDKVNEFAKNEGFFLKNWAKQTSKLVTALILLLLNILLMAILIMLCILIIGYQILMLIYIILGIFVFLLALIPYYGIDLVKRWGVKIVGTACMKILLVFFLSMLMVFMSVIYKFVDTYGLLIVLVIMVAMAVMIYIKKDEIIGLFSSINLSNINLQAVDQTMNRAMDKDINTINNLRNMAKGIDGNAQSTRETNTTQGKNYTEPQGYQATKNTETIAQANLVDLREATENIAGTTKDLSGYFDKAEELLQRSYEKSKSAAEETATRNNSEPEYGAFVTRTNAIRELGAGNFDQRDISSVANLVRSTEERGGDINKIIADGTTKDRQPARKPENLQAQSVSHGTQQSVEIEKPQELPKGIDYFKGAFGEEKGERMYEDLSSKYDAVKLDTFSSNEKLNYSQIRKRLQDESKQKGLKQEAVTMRGQDEEE